MRTTKEMDYIIQDLLDWLFDKQEAINEVPTVEEMRVWLIKGYKVTLGRKQLEEVRMAVVNSKY